MSRGTLLLSALMAAASAQADLTAEIGVYSPPHCAYADGRLYVGVQGGVTCGGCMYMYHILWSTGDSTSMISGVAAGTYWVMVIDAVQDTVYDTLSVAVEDFMPIVNWIPLCPDTLIGPMFEGFIRGHSGVLWVDQMVGPGPHNLTGGFTEVLYTDTFNIGFFDTAYHIIPPVGWGSLGTGGIINYTDVNGCGGQIYWSVPQAIYYDPVQVLQVDGACTGGSNGHLRLHTTPAPYSLAGDDIHVLRRVDGSPFPSLYENLYIGADVQRFYQQLPAGDYAFVQQFGAASSGSPFLAFLEPWFGGEACYDSTFVTILDNGLTCGTLKGKVFVDSDENCFALYSEAPIPAMVMEIQPGNHYTLSSSTGNYAINLPVGSGYVATQQTTAFDEHCTGGTTFSIVSGGTTTRDQADTSLTGLDAAIGMGSGAARPGFQLGYGFDIANLTAANTGALTVTMVLDPVISFISASVTPTSVVGNTITWNLPNQNGFTQSHLTVQCQVPPDPFLIGDTLTSTILLSTATTDIDPSNNSFSHDVIVTGSFDPNDKSVSPADFYLIGTDSILTYTIRFQNTGTDTAFMVVVVDTLPPTVDPATFEMVAASHPYTLDMRGQGILRFMFPWILLPDSTTNEPLSHGFVSFRIKPRAPLLPGTTISNNADIYFDFNPPVRTNDAVVVATLGTHVAEYPSDVVYIFPNPTDGLIHVRSGEAPFHSVDIHALDGRILLSWGIQGRTAQFDLATLVAGAYVVRMHFTDGTTSDHVLVKH